MDALLSELLAFGAVVVVDIVFAGDNAIVVGMVAARLPPSQQWRIITLGIIAAMICRIGFAVIAVQLLAIIGLLFAGGLLLLWVAWKMWRDLRATLAEAAGEAALEAATADPPSPVNAAPAVGMASAVGQVVVADVSMSLDNVLAVAGTARDHVAMLIFGLVLSVALMGVAATFIARILTRVPWLNYIGLAIVTVVALSMIWEGGAEILAELSSDI